MTPSYTYAATVERVVDGDTLDVSLDLGMRVYLRTRLRLEGIDAPELHTSEGKAARDYVVQAMALGTLVTVATRKPDRYGRALARVTLPDGRDLTTVLLEAGHGRPYDGGAR